MKYTNEQIIQSLQQKARETGNTPTQAEVDADKNMPSCFVIRHRFGSWQNALLAAGLKVRSIKKAIVYTDKELIGKLQNFSLQLCKTPSATDIRRARNEMPRVETYASRFGSWNNTLRKAGLPTTEVGSPIDAKQFTDRKQTALNALKTCYQEKGRLPTTKDFSHTKNYGISYRTITVYFGGWNEALKVANLNAFKAPWWKKILNKIRQNWSLKNI